MQFDRLLKRVLFFLFFFGGKGGGGFGHSTSWTQMMMDIMWKVLEQLWNSPSLFSSLLYIPLLIDENNTGCLPAITMISFCWEDSAACLISPLHYEREIGQRGRRNGSNYDSSGGRNKVSPLFYFFFLLRDGSAREHERIRCIYNASIVPVSRWSIPSPFFFKYISGYTNDVQVGCR